MASDKKNPAVQVFVHGITAGGLDMTYGQKGGGSGDTVELWLPLDQSEKLRTEMARDGWIWTQADDLTAEVRRPE